MRHIFSRRPSAKRSASQSKGKGANMAATAHTTDGGGVVVAVAGGGGGNNGSNTPSSPVPEWSGDPVALKEFASKRKVPGFARIVKGSYMTLGSSKFSLQKQHQEVYVHAVKMGVKVLAHCVKRVDVPGGPRRGQGFTSRLYAMDQRLAVPISYQGWFELMSEDGKSARPISTVAELARAGPKRCLVRENLKGYVATGEGRLTFDKTKILPAGEQLKLSGEVSLPAPSQNARVKLLRCLDTKGDNVYLSFDQKGLFTPISDDSDFTGVFTIRDIVRRFRLPLTVKLAHGVRPRVPDSKFSGLIRLDWVYTEETAFLCPLEKNHVRLLPVPSDVSLQMVAAANQDDLVNSDMFRSLQAKCTRMVNNYNNTLHLIVTLPEQVIKTHTRNARSSNLFSAPLSTGDDGSAPPSSRVRRSRSREDVLMAEIDDLYGYVRDGGAPPNIKCQYDSDEESYWEEPAYEPLDQFQARLKALETGQRLSFTTNRYPAPDPGQLKGLVGGAGGGGTVTVPTPTPAPAPAPATGQGQSQGQGQSWGAAGGSEQGPAATPEGDYGVLTAPGHQGGSPATASSHLPPPLPPRRADLLPAAAITSSNTNNIISSSRPSDTTAAPNTNTNTTSTTIINTSTNTITTINNSDNRTNTTGHAARRKSSTSSPDDSPAQLTQVRRLSSSALTSSPPPAVSTVTVRKPSLDVTDSVPSSGEARMSRSGSEPAVTLTSTLTSFPASSAAARPSSSQRQQQGGEAVKLDWKERLRRFNALEDKDGSSSASSGGSPGGSPGGKGAGRLARDFKDSDISSRTKATSSSSGKGARKRMQTLYL